MEIKITGIRFRERFAHLEEPERSEAVGRFVSEMPRGQRLLLVKESDNVKDSNAVAVYLDTEKIGYVASPGQLMLSDYLSEDGELWCEVFADDEHLTLFAKVIDVEEKRSGIVNKPRTLPEPCLPPTVYLSLLEADRSIKLVARLLFGSDVQHDDPVRLYELADEFEGFAHNSFCYEDSVWRQQVVSLLDDLYVREDITEELGASITALINFMGALEGDIHRCDGGWLLDCFEAQMKALRAVAEEDGGLYAKFDQYYFGGSLDEAEPMAVREQLERLQEWFSEMPWAELRRYNERCQMVVRLNYLGVTRKELYDVYSALLLIERLEAWLAEHAGKDGKKAGGIPVELKMQDAKKVMGKLVEAGLLDRKWQPTSDTKSGMCGMMAYWAAKKLCIDNVWVVFANLWGRQAQSLRSSYNRYKEGDAGYEFEKRLKRIKV